jgi:hypothetical protein
MIRALGHGMPCCPPMLMPVWAHVQAGGWTTANQAKVLVATQVHDVPIRIVAYRDGWAVELNAPRSRIWPQAGPPRPHTIAYCGPRTDLDPSLSSAALSCSVPPATPVPLLFPSFLPHLISTSPLLALLETPQTDLLTILNSDLWGPLSVSGLARGCSRSLTHALACCPPGSCQYQGPVSTAFTWVRYLAA